MDRYAQLKAKWMEIAEGLWPEAVFDTDLLSAGKFVMFFSENAPDEQCELGAYFDSIHDGLAFLRFIEIPVGLDHDSGIKSYEVRPAESFLDRYSGTQRKDLEGLLDELDTLLRSDGMTPGAVDRVIGKYNTCFGNLKTYSGSIHAWGQMTQVLSSPHLWDIADHLVDMDPDESELLGVLKELLDSGKFNEKYDRHVRMARKFFEIVRVV